MGEGSRRLTIVITDSEFGDARIERDVLADLGDVRLANARSPEDVAAVARDADALLVQYAQITPEVIDALERLRVVVRYGIGLDNIDLDHARSRGVVVRNVVDYCIAEVADHVTAAISSGARRLRLYDLAVKSGGWGAGVVQPPLPPSEDPVGIAGYGRIGAAVATRLGGLGHPIVVWEALAPERALEDGLICVSSLGELAQAVNHLSLHVPSTPQTAGMVCADVLDRLGASAHLVNTGRGNLIDEHALLRWLGASPHRLASLDVFCDEPPSTGSSRDLAGHPRVVATPHVGYLSTASLPRLRSTAAALVREELLGSAGVAAC
jgi:D-3-phosphoglycerate dehydrogenase